MPFSGFVDSSATFCQTWQYKLVHFVSFLFFSDNKAAWHQGTEVVFVDFEPVSHGPRKKLDWNNLHCLFLLAGVTVSEALKKAMKNRQLLPEACIVYRCSDPHKTPIPWDSDISQVLPLHLKCFLLAFSWCNTTHRGGA